MGVSAVLTRSFKKGFIHLINLVCKALPPDPISNRLRPKLLKLIGYRVGRGTSIATPGYMHGGTAEIGADCFVNMGCYFDLSGKVTIGDNVHIGHGVTIVTTEHAMGGPDERCGPPTGLPVDIGSGAWIGANATVLAGVSIGKGAVVASGAIVTKSVPDNVLVGGVPAKVLRNLDPGVLNAFRPQESA
jgi:maltose O-acetyltransferase